MNAAEHTHSRRLAAALAIHGARTGRKHIARTAAIDSQLHRLVPGTAEIRTTPVTVDDERRIHVLLINDLAQPLTPGPAYLAAVLRILCHFFPGADWTTPQRYTVRTGTLTDDAPTVPADLDLDTVEEARP